MISSLFRMKAGVLVCLMALLLPSGALWAQDADLDPSFSIGTGFCCNPVLDMAIQPDGKILVVGLFGDYNGSAVNQIVRLNQDGSIDPTFNTSDWGNFFSGTIKAVALQSDGKIIVGADGSWFNANYWNLARLNSDGSFDSSFSTSLQGGVLESVSVEANDQILLGGDFFPGWRLLRLYADGSLGSVLMENASSFDPFALPGPVRDIEIQSNGKFTVVGGEGSSGFIGRFNSDGSADATFNSGSLVSFSGGPAMSLAVQTDGKLVAAGSFWNYNGSFSNGLVRILDNGVVDNTFNTGNGFNGTVSELVIQNDGRILAAGFDFTTYNGSNAIRIARINSDGTLDATFNSGSGFNDAVRTLLVQPDGKILVGGAFSSYNGTSMTRFVRLNGSSTVAPPTCNAGTLTSPSAATLCPTEFYTFDATGVVVPDGYFYGLQIEPGNNGAGGTGATLYISEVPVPWTFNGDLNGILSGAGLSPLSGIWEFTGIVYSDPNDIAGSICATGTAASITYLQCDCTGVEGGTAFIDGCGTCVEGTTGLTSCDQTCWQPSVSMLSPETIAYDYNNANFWGIPVGYHAPITAEAVAYADVVDGSNLACNASAASLDGKIAVILRGGCAFSVKAYNAQLAGAVAVVVVNSEPGDVIFPMGASVNAELINIPVVMIGNNAGSALLSTIANGPVQMFIGNACVPGACNAGTLASPSAATLCPGEFYSFEVDSVSVPAGANYALLYQPGASGTGALGGGFYITVPSLPYSFDADINGVLSSNALPPLAGEWFVSGVVYTDPAALGASICSSTATSVSLNFLDAAAPACQPEQPGCTDSDAANYDPSANLDNGSCVYNVVFRVDMAQVTDPYTTPEVNGTFNGWCGGCAPMTNVGGSVWELTIALAPGTYEFKYAADAWNISEQLIPGTPCTITTNGFTNRILQVVDQGIDLGTVCWASCNACENPPVTYDVVFRVDMSQVTDPFTTPEVNGIFNGWCGGCAPMTNTGGDVWEITIALTPGLYEYKFAADSWNVQEQLTPGDFCTLTTGNFTNRLVEVIDQNIVLDVVCWGSCVACVQAQAGCTYAAASNYMPDATVDDGSCIFEGCTDPEAVNYTPLATADDGSCDFATSNTCPSDVTGDGVVNLADLLALLAALGLSCE